jgi:hypothetical protein
VGGRSSEAGSKQHRQAGKVLVAQLQQMDFVSSRTCLGWHRMSGRTVWTQDYCNRARTTAHHTTTTDESVRSPPTHHRRHGGSV